MISSGILAALDHKQDQVLAYNPLESIEQPLMRRAGWII